MKDNWPKIILLEYLLVSLIGCNPVGNPDVPNTLMPSPLDMTPTVGLPQQGESAPMISNSPAAPTGLENLIEKAKDDLAQRLAIPATQVNLVESTEVDWSDSSLGCPQPGMFYLQIITPGYLILLEANAAQYEYHSNREAYVVYCENSSPPIPKP